MNTITATLCIGFLAASSILCAQSTTVDSRWGEEFNVKGADFKYLLHEEGVGTFAFMKKIKLSKGNEYTLIAFDEAGNEKKRALVALEPFGKKVIQLQFVQKRLYLFFAQQEKKAKQHHLFAQQIDPISMEKLGEPIALASYPLTIENTELESSAYHIHFSHDESKVAISHGIPRIKKGSALIRLKVFDGVLKALEEKEIPYEQGKEKFKLIETVVSDVGDLVLLASVGEGTGLFNNSGPTKIMIKHFPLQGGEAKEYTLATGDRHLSDLILDVDAGTVNCMGLFSNKSTRYAAGCVSVRIDLQKQEKDYEHYLDFDDAFIQGVSNYDPLTAGKQKLNIGASKGELLMFDIREVVQLSDGRRVLVGEHYMHQSGGSSYNNVTGKSRNWVSTTHMRDLIIICLSQDGKIDWSTSVAKKQLTANGNLMSSYALLVSDDHLHLIFNDNEKNAQYKPGDKVYNMAQGFGNKHASLVTIAPDGSSQKSALFKELDNAALPMPKRFISAGEKQMLMYGKGKQSHHVGLIRFDR